jgi:hypothetical protein
MGSSRPSRKLLVELNFFEYSDSKRCYSEPDEVEYKKGSRPQYDLILGTETMKELGIMLDFKAKAITIILPIRNINHLQGASTLQALKLNNSLAIEPQSTQDATKCATLILDAKYNKEELQSIVKDYCKHVSTDQIKSYCSLTRNMSCSLMAP